MTLQELYKTIEGDYEQAMKVLRMEKLLDKHIRKLLTNGVVENLIAAGNKMDPGELFETAHAVKGVCANLGLLKLSEAASDIANEYRPGAVRKYSDADVRAKLDEIEELYRKTADGIRLYENS